MRSVKRHHTTRPLTYAEARAHVLDRTLADAEWDEDNGYARLPDAPPCHWVAMVEAAAVSGAL